MRHTIQTNKNSENNTKMLDVILLFNGNFMGFPVPDYKKEEFTNFLKLESATKTDPLHWTCIGEDYWFLTKNLIGFYFRPHVEKSTPEKMLDEVKKITKISNDGESWKSNDDE